MLEQISLLDIVLGALLLIFLVRSIFRGLVREVISLVGLVTAVLLSAIFYNPLAAAIAHWFNMGSTPPEWLEPVAYGAILLLVILVFAYLGHLLSKIIRKGPFSGVDRLLGLAAGLVKGILVCYLLINLLLLLAPFGVPTSLQRSWLQPKILQAGGYLVSLVPEQWTASLRERAAKLQEQMSSPKGAAGGSPTQPTQ